LTSPNLGLALARWCRHHGLLTQDVSLSVTQEGSVAWLGLQEHPERHDLGVYREFCTVSLLRNALGVACWLTDSRIALRGVELAFAAPAHEESYPILFEGPVSFDAPLSRMGFDAGYLQLPIRRDEAALQRMLKRALVLTVRPYRRDRLLVDRVREALQQQPELMRRADALATHLNVSERTLHRQLREEGESLQAIKDRVRRDLALTLLRKTQQPLARIASAVGMSNEKSFARAFKHWTGLTPEEARRPAAPAITP
ncbi:MAG: Urease operon transcriptional activator, partial [Pseudomonadota bacterium]